MKSTAIIKVPGWYEVLPGHQSCVKVWSLLSALKFIMFMKFRCFI